MEVIINGEPYAPAAGSTKIAVAISTHNRHDILADTLTTFRKHLPAGADLIVVDDASTKPVTVPEGVTLVRNATRRGIAGTKNRCLDELMKTSADHFFLSDDDVRILSPNFWKPYVESPEPHLATMFDTPKGETGRQLEVLYEDDHHLHYHAARGYFLYTERRVVETVGGMDPGFKRWGFEHVSWSDRIHSAGFTTSRYIDVKGSADLVYSMDEGREVTSTASKADMEHAENEGMDLRMKSRDSAHFIEYRELEDVVLSTLLCNLPDPQRGQKMKATSGMVKALHDSVKGHRFVLLTTGIEGNLPHAEMEPVHQHLQPYFQRWVSVYQWLRDNPSVGRVWCVDATDVTLNRNPFPEMEEGLLYFGYEPTTLRDGWMVKSHPDTTLQTFMKNNPNLPLLNMGVVGGDRGTVMRFAHAMGKFYFDDHNDFIMGWETQRAGVGDMAAGNYIARTHYPETLSSGPHVTNVFKTKVGTAQAWWHHKAE